MIETRFLPGVTYPAAAVTERDKVIGVIEWLEDPERRRKWLRENSEEYRRLLEVRKTAEEALNAAYRQKLIIEDLYRRGKIDREKYEAGIRIIQEHIDWLESKLEEIDEAIKDAEEGFYSEFSMMLAARGGKSAAMRGKIKWLVLIAIIGLALAYVAERLGWIRPVEVQILEERRKTALMLKEKGFEDEHIVKIIETPIPEPSPGILDRIGNAIMYTGMGFGFIGAVFALSAGVKLIGELVEKIFPRKEGLYLPPPRR